MGTRSDSRCPAWRRLRVAAFLAGAGVSLLTSSGVGHSEGPGATVVGRVLFRGAVPPAQEIAVTRDPEVCGATRVIQPVAVDPSTKGLLNVVVSVEEKAGDGGAAPPVVAVVTNQKCAFTNRVMTARTGAMLEVRNADPVMHNTHVRVEKRTFLNVALVAGGRPVQKPIKVTGVLNVQCDRHKFMQGYVMAFDHPYYALTDAAGTFRITGVPAGLRTVTVWHETLGTMKKEVQVPASGDLHVTFEVAS